LRKSLINQSEILTLCGTALILGDFFKLGVTLLVIGIFSALARYAIEFQLLTDIKEKQEGDNESLEKLLAESFSDAFTREN
jgi:hypothetical protein